MMLLSMCWVGRRDGKYIVTVGLPKVVIEPCPEQAAIFDTAVLGDFGVAECAMCIARGS